jgi:hypothetical protein
MYFKKLLHRLIARFKRMTSVLILTNWNKPSNQASKQATNQPASQPTESTQSDNQHSKPRKQASNKPTNPIKRSHC